MSYRPNLTPFSLRWRSMQEIISILHGQRVSTWVLIRFLSIPYQPMGLTLMTRI